MEPAKSVENMEAVEAADPVEGVEPGEPQQDYDFVVRRRTRWYTHVGDFLNTLKAFIGTNYQGLPFAFANSGLALGLVGVFVIASLTDHCCQILIRSKSYIVEKTVQHELEKAKITEREVESLRERLNLTIGYGDIAMRVYGEWCFHVTQACVCFTQFMVCVMYFVFIANTIYEIYPMKRICPDLSGVGRETMMRVKTERGGYGIPVLHIPNVARNLSARYRRSATECNSSNEKAMGLARNLPPQTDFNLNLMLSAEKEKLVRSRFSSAGKIELSKLMVNESREVNLTASTALDEPQPCKNESTAPDLRILVLYPLPIFILTSIVRNIRYLAPFSSIATISLFGGAISVLAYLVDGFQVTNIHWYKLWTYPLFICQIIAAYEGIGCILPIQSSMVGCRHLFPAYIHANIYIIFAILCVFGSLGYLRYGEDVKQILVLQIPQHSYLSIIVDVTLIISVIFTYPLQCYPVIEIMEAAILLPSNCCKKNTVHDAESSSERPRDEPPNRPRGRSIDFTVSEHTMTVVPSTVPAWKRNTIRVGVTLVITGLAVVLRDYFAYISALGGSIGAFLAFILPCMIDIRLRYDEMSRPIMIKNIIIIIFTIIASILGLVGTAKRIYDGLSAGH